jgi:diguanylate cyclase (GGDEF)-like protein
MVRDARLVLCLAVIYYCADTFLNHFAFSDGWTILWPLNGISIALLLMRQRRDWPALMLGIAIGTGIGECRNQNPIGFEILQRFISLLEVYLSALILPPFDTFAKWLRRPFIFRRFMGALLVGPAISGVFASIQFHYSQGQSYAIAFNSWATADALGIAATLPLALSLRSPEMWRLFHRDQLFRTLSVLTFAVCAAGIILSVSRYPLLFMLFPALLLVESLLAFSGAAIAVFFTSLLAVYFAIHGQGPFGSWPADRTISRDGALQIFLGFNFVALFPASLLSMERRRMSEELLASNILLTTLAATDSLTGLANRRTLDQAFFMEWKRAVRVQTELALLVVDIDHFKQFNDLYGHPEGDCCLKVVADLLKAHLRRPQDVAARFGGEEFVLLLPQTGLDDAFALAERIREGVQGLALPHDGSAFGCVTVSIGCAAAIPSYGDEHLQLLQAADAALYVAKHVGRNCVRMSSTASGTNRVDEVSSEQEAIALSLKL